jgi:hypothetical protein
MTPVTLSSVDSTMTTITQSAEHLFREMGYLYLWFRRRRKTRGLHVHHH